MRRWIGLWTMVMLALAIGPRSGLACPSNTRAHHRCDEPTHRLPPATVPCCDLAAPCGTSIALPAPATAAPVLNGGNLLGAVDEAVPTFHIQSPEPPPPKR